MITLTNVRGQIITANEGVRLVNCSLCVIENCIVDNGENIEVEGGDCIIVQACSVSNFSKYAFRFIGVKNVDVLGCNADTGENDGFKFTQGCEDVFMLGCTARHCGRDGVDLYSDTVKARIQDCVFEENALFGLDGKEVVGATVVNMLALRNGIDLKMHSALLSVIRQCTINTAFLYDSSQLVFTRNICDTLYLHSTNAFIANNKIGKVIHGEPPCLPHA